MAAHNLRNAFPRINNEDLNNLVPEVEQLQERRTLPFDRYVDEVNALPDTDTEYIDESDTTSTDFPSQDDNYVSEPEKADFYDREILPDQPDDTEDELSSDQFSDNHDQGIKRMRPNSEEYIESDGELQPQDEEMKEIVNQLAPPVKHVQKQNKLTALRLIQSRTHVMHKDYDPLQPPIDDDRMKLLRDKSRRDLTPLVIVDPPPVVDGERYPSNGELVRNLTAAQRTIANSLIDLCEDGKALATETILDSFELVAGATGLVQQNRRRGLSSRDNRLSRSRPPVSAALSARDKKSLRESKSIGSASNARRGYHSRHFPKSSRGGRSNFNRSLLTHRKSWEDLGALHVLDAGAQAFWICQSSPIKLQKLRRYQEFRGTEMEEKIYQEALQEELRLGIVEEVSMEKIKFFNRTFVIKSKDKRFRKILDCRTINHYLKDISYKNENLNTIYSLAQENDYAVTIDIHNAYNHILVSEELQPYLGFAFRKKAYLYKGLPFGLKSAPLIFHQNLLPAITKIRASGIRTMVYIDDILLLDQNYVQLEATALKVTSLLEDLGWHISNKSILTPSHQAKYLGWDWNFSKLNIRIPEDTRKKLISRILRFRSKSRRRKVIRVKFLSPIIGSLIYLRTQFPRASLHLKLLYNALQRALHQQGWKGILILQPKLQRDWNWWITSLKQNYPRTFRNIAPQATLVTDASSRGWGATLVIHRQLTKIYCPGRWTKKWRLRTNNQRELAAVLCGLTRFSENLRKEKISSLSILTDNTTTSYNLNRQNSSVQLTHLLESTLIIAENLGIKIKATYLPGKYNQEADALSRLNRAGDYSLRKEVYLRITSQLSISPTIDLFANNRTALNRRYCTISFDHNAIARDAFTIP
ncbi:MAG: putative reverse transcriptase [Streblomastix strix]|uniref:Putative reverse transcriptase n=1 Tax=Streblomastix strix TaxID=222440 RepID=A0A5J4VQQ4_9EUKA|nr:MAG: putative reverse transcriptase [Streblomastix strix]